jgi:hypothetical protein
MDELTATAATCAQLLWLSVAHVKFAEDRRKEIIIFNPLLLSPLLGRVRLTAEIAPPWQGLASE